jgi:3-oxoacyl-[acyl-carrier protein] reductase
MLDKWILVTGGSGVIGRATVHELAKEWNVVFTWHSGEEQSQSLLTLCESLPGRVEGIRCDGRDEVMVNDRAAKLVERLGAPYGIIHNAGITLDALHLLQTSDNWRQVMDTNLNAVFHWNKPLLPAMIAQREGAIVMMSSVSGIKGNVGQTAYAASKAAMIGLSRSLALEVGRFGIRVNSILPGFIDSEMLQSLTKEKMAAIRSLIPMKRLGQPEEIASAVAWLVGDGSRYMTGQTLVIDGGITA